MVETADVLVENFRPSVPARLGIDYPRLKAIILQTVPWASLPRVGCPAAGPCCRAWADNYLDERNYQRGLLRLTPQLNSV
jgi:CoA transferase family III